MFEQRNGILFIGGCSSLDLAASFGTPLYVMDETVIRENCRSYLAAFAAYPAAEVLYASKACMNRSICRIIEEEGLSLDVVSGGELHTALAVGYPPQRIYFHGSNKTLAEMEYALEAGIGCFVVDSGRELNLLSGLASRRGRAARLLLRVTPGIEAHTHEFIRTGQLDSKFGFPLATGQAMEAVEQALRLPFLELAGVHCHIGSQILDTEPFVLAAEVMLDFLAQVRAKTGSALTVLDLGGGLGIHYVDEDDPPTIAAYAASIVAKVREKTEALGLPTPRLLVEPGRSIVGEAGVTLYSVGTIKEIPGVRTYLSVDGGMGDNPRHALYGSRYRALLANKAGFAPRMRVTVAGRHCESGDILIRNLELPAAAEGDILAVLATGAYNYSMSSNYNRFPRPAMVLVGGGRAELIVRRETYADLEALDLVPDRLGAGRPTALPAAGEE